MSRNLAPEEALVLLESLDIPEEKKAEVREELAIAAELRKGIDAIGERLRAGEEISWETMTQLFDQVAQNHHVPYGIPIPHVSDREDCEHPLVMAKNGPMGQMMNAQYLTEAAERYGRSWKRHVRNSWDVLGDHTMMIVDTEQGPMWIKEPHAGQRLRKIMADLSIRSEVPMTADAELKALESLRTKINPQQYRTYVLSGLFIETSTRSDLRYIFRKGRPTLVLSYHGEDAAGGRVIAALCFHPVGYYAYSHAGCMVPTDEVIAALLMMRVDERRYWAKSGQWSVSDSRAGV